jgi:hypothetical protein
MEARVIKIETVPFNPLDWDDTITKGKCSNCNMCMLSQPDYGFPTKCPDCGALLLNGTDTCPWTCQRRTREANA